MPATRFDVLNAIETLRARRERTTGDDIAAELGTDKRDVVPELMSAVRDGLVVTAKQPDGSVEYDLTREGDMLLADEAQ